MLWSDIFLPISAPLKISVSDLSRSPCSVLLSVSEEFEKTCVFCSALRVNGVFKFSVFLVIFVYLM